MHHNQICKAVQITIQVSVEMFSNGGHNAVLCKYPLAYMLHIEQIFHYTCAMFLRPIQKFKRVHKYLHTEGHMLKNKYLHIPKSPLFPKASDAHIELALLTSQI